MKKISDILCKKYTAAVLLGIVICLQIVRMAVVYCSGDHYLCDEVYSYGLSNSFYMPAIEQSSFRSGGKIININEWKDGKMFHDYLTVQKGEQFRYDSVWYNQSLDRHPPLFYAALHTVSSFFPDVYSYWYGFALNAIYFIVAQIFLYKLMKHILKSRYLALLVCLFWGLSGAAIDLVLFIRMYCMLVMWVIMFEYFNEKLYCSCRDKVSFKKILPVMITVTCGALTQHLFLTVAFLTVAVYCIKYLIERRFKLFWAYGFSMAGAVAAAFLIFPPAVSQLIEESSTGSIGMLRKQFIIGFRAMNSKVFGIEMRHLVIYIPSFLLILLILFVLSLPVQYLFRQNAHLKKFYADVIAAFKDLPQNIRRIDIKQIKIWSSVKEKVKDSSPLIVSMVICVFAVVLIVSYKISFVGNDFILRYMFAVCPLAAAALIGILYFFISKLRHRKIVMSAILSVMCLVTFINAFSHYQRKFDADIKELDVFFADTNCIIVEPEKEAVPVFCVLPKEMMSVNKFFLTYYDAIENNMDKLVNIEKDRELYIIFCEETKYGYLKYIDMLEELYGKSVYQGQIQEPNCKYAVYKFISYGK